MPLGEIRLYTLHLGCSALGHESSSLSGGTMKQIIIRYKDKSYRVTISGTNTNILDSYSIKSITDMRNIIKEVKNKVSDNSMAIHHRSLFSMMNEWRVHNLLYSFGIQKDRTKSVDLDLNQPWYMKVAYILLSPLYFHFS